MKKFALQREGEVGSWKLIVRKGDEERSFAETEAVVLACDRFMHQRQSMFVRALRQAAVELDRELRELDREQVEAARGLEGQRRMEEDRCEDIHPKCEDWADKGECVRNPNYMLNYCRISCGICEGESTFERCLPLRILDGMECRVWCRVGEYFLGFEARMEVEQKSAELLVRLREELCPSPTPAVTKTSPIQEIKYQPLLKKNEISDISRALYIELKDKCLLLFRGWWTYEICFYSQIRQMHYASDGETLETSQLIGAFTEQHVQHIRPLLLPEDEMERYGVNGERRPYILQIYENGDPCGEGNAERSATVRLMCSDDLKQGPLSADTLGATIDEPTECQYVVNVFLPLMCHYPEYKRQSQET